MELALKQEFHSIVDSKELFQSFVYMFVSIPRVILIVFLNYSYYVINEDFNQSLNGEWYDQAQFDQWYQSDSTI